MVRLNIADGETLIVGGVTYAGPLEFVADSFDLTGHSLGVVHSGEFLMVSGAVRQTSEYMREEVTIAFPVCMTLAMLFALTWMRKYA
jgi:hypothetical protein